MLALPELGTNAGPTVPLLIQELKHPNHYYRERAASTLAGLDIEPDIVIPALRSALSDVSPAVRFHAIDGLANFGTRARPAAAGILRIMQEEENLRWTASNALTRIAPDMLTNAPSR